MNDISIEEFLMKITLTQKLNYDPEYHPKDLIFKINKLFELDSKILADNYQMSEYLGYNNNKNERELIKVSLCGFL